MSLDIPSLNCTRYPSGKNLITGLARRQSKQNWGWFNGFKKVDIGHVYFQMATEKSKKKGINLINYLNDLIATDYQRKK